MAKIVELRGMSNQRLEEMLENNREEIFNLRFQKAGARLEDYTRIRTVRREIAQIETVLHMRQLAIETAVSEPAIAAALSGKEWQATASFNYEDSAWNVAFTDESDQELASALVDLNKKRLTSRRARQQKQPLPVVTSIEVAG
ncbi:MAG: 50S ribosomal protein L29 [Anaerolineales bacterium]|nr:50S ribosomal protein L29 [Anaerolineales bacterium]